MPQAGPRPLETYNAPQHLKYLWHEHAVELSTMDPTALSVPAARMMAPAFVVSLLPIIVMPLVKSISGVRDCRRTSDLCP
jgi:hypothetical protein